MAAAGTTEIAGHDGKISLAQQAAAKVRAQKVYITGVLIGLVLTAISLFAIPGGD